jgi:hypothetical protein
LENFGRKWQVRQPSPSYIESVNGPARKRAARTPAPFGANLNRPKEIDMLKNRSFNVFIAIALVMVVALTVREALATTVIATKTGSVISCDSLPARSSVHTKYLKEADMWVPYTADGPTGVDGGLRELFTAYRTCSR